VRRVFKNVRFDVLTAVTVKSTNFCHVTPRNRVEFHLSFRGLYRFHLHRSSTCCLLDLLLDPEEGRSTFFRNVSTPTIQYSAVHKIFLELRTKVESNAHRGWRRGCLFPMVHCPVNFLLYTPKECFVSLKFITVIRQFGVAIVTNMSSFHKLHEGKLRSRSKTSENYFVSVYRVYFVSIIF
jgi:hypothetical protein